ncbi:MAG: hypothetical protein HQM09_15030 [Candidatus Riflebacteria bacterium]|nr:hypothetical protein [Candidatus Riflebacteria bacterium]
MDEIIVSGPTHPLNNSSDPVIPVIPTLGSILGTIARGMGVELPLETESDSPVPEQTELSQVAGSITSSSGITGTGNTELISALLGTKCLAVVPAGVTDEVLTLVGNDFCIHVSANATGDTIEALLLSLDTHLLYAFDLKGIWMPLVKRFGPRVIPPKYVDIALLAQLLGFIDPDKPEPVLDIIRKIAVRMLPGIVRGLHDMIQADVAIYLTRLFPSIAHALLRRANMEWHSLRPFEIENEFCSELIRMEATGIPVNKVFLEQEHADWVKKFDRFSAKLQKAEIKPFLDDSEAKARSAGLTECLHEFYQAKSYLDFLRPYVELEGTRVYSHFTQMSCVTGRMSAKNPPVQGIRKTLKKVFYAADDGKSIISVDLPSSQLRVLAEVTADECLIQQFMQGIDVYAAMAAEILSKPVSEVTHDSLERALGKTLVFGVLFGMKAENLVIWIIEQTGKMISHKEGERFLNSFFEHYPSVKAYRDKIEAQIKQGPTNLYSLGGRAIWVDKHTKAMNYPISASEIEIVKVAATQFGKECRERGLDARLINIVHDNLVVEVLNEDRADAMQLLKEVVESAMNNVLTRFKSSVKVELLAGPKKITKVERPPNPDRPIIRC